MTETAFVHHEATKTNSKQDAAYIRHFQKASKDLKTKSKQNALYIRYFHASPKSFKTPLKPTVNKLLIHSFNLRKERTNMPNRTYIRTLQILDKHVSQIVRTFEQNDFKC